MHDGVKNNEYTFKEIKDAIIPKIQTTFEPSKLIMNSLRDSFKKGPHAMEKTLIIRWIQ